MFSLSCDLDLITENIPMSRLIRRMGDIREGTLFADTINLVIDPAWLTFDPGLIHYDLPVIVCTGNRSSSHEHSDVMWHLIVAAACWLDRTH